MYEYILYELELVVQYNFIYSVVFTLYYIYIIVLHTMHVHVQCNTSTVKCICNSPLSM